MQSTTKWLIAYFLIMEEFWEEIVAGYQTIEKYASNEVRALNDVVSKFMKHEADKDTLVESFDAAVLSDGFTNLISALTRNTLLVGGLGEDLPRTLASQTMGIVFNPRVTVRCLVINPDQIVPILETNPCEVRSFFNCENASVRFERYKQQNGIKNLRLIEEHGVSSKIPYDFLPNESIRINSDGYCCAFQLLTSFQKNFYLYDSNSLELVGERPTDPSVSRWIFIAHILWKKGTKRSFALLERLSLHPDPIVRWEVAKVTIKKSIQEGLYLLEKYTEDPDPTIRKKAKSEHTRISNLLRKNSG